MATVREIFYSVQPGDSLARIAAKSGGTLLPLDRNQRLAKLIELNPQIKSPDVIYPGELIRLGSVDGHLNPASNSDLGEVRKVWKNLTKDTREIIQKNFDVLEWMARQKDRLDFLDNVSWQGKPLLEAIPEMNYGVIPGEYRRFRIALEELTAIRGNTISILQSLRISVVREPVFILTATSNGLYKYSQTLLKMVEWAEKVKLGKKLFFFEVGSEVVKVGATAAITKSGVETSKQVGRGFIKVASGYGAGVLAKRVCSVTVRKGPSGWLTCAAAFGVGIWGSQYAAGKLSDILLGKPIDAQLRGMP